MTPFSFTFLRGTPGGAGQVEELLKKKKIK